MKSLKIGAATEEPVSCPPQGCLPSVLGVSNPTNTPNTRSGEKPMNQVSFESFVVPVLPASGLPIVLMRRPVPRCTTPSSMVTI